TPRLSLPDALPICRVQSPLYEGTRAHEVAGAVLPLRHRLEGNGVGGIAIQCRVEVQSGLFLHAGTLGTLGGIGQRPGGTAIPRNRSGPPEPAQRPAPAAVAAN